MCACLPTLRPLIRRLSGSSGASTRSSSPDSQKRWSAPVDEESGILGTPLAPVPPAHIRLASSQELEIIEGGDWTSEFHGDEIRPVSQSSQANEISSPVSAAESLA